MKKQLIVTRLQAAVKKFFIRGLDVECVLQKS